MAKGKYKYWRTQDGLTLLRGWARDGLKDIDIAHRCAISESTLYDWKNRFPEISEALKKGKEVVDIEVENALLEKCFGYTIQVRKTFKCKVVDYDPSTGKRIREHEELVTGYDDIHVPADTTAQIYWLNNRRPDAWRNKREDRIHEEENTGVIVLPEVDIADA